MVDTGSFADVGLWTDLFRRGERKATSNKLFNKLPVVH